MSLKVAGSGGPCESVVVVISVAAGRGVVEEEEEDGVGAVVVVGFGLEKRGIVVEARATRERRRGAEGIVMMASVREMVRTRRRSENVKGVVLDICSALR